MLIVLASEKIREKLQIIDFILISFLFIFFLQIINFKLNTQYLTIYMYACMTYHDVLTLHLRKSKDQDQKSPKLNHTAVILLTQN